MKTRTATWIIILVLLALCYSMRAEPIKLTLTPLGTNNIYGMAMLKISFNIPANHRAELEIVDYLGYDEFWLFHYDNQEPAMWSAEPFPRTVSKVIAANYFPHLFFRVAAYPVTGD